MTEQEEIRKKEQGGEKTKQQKIRDIVIEYGIYALIVIVCAFVIPRYVVQRTIVNGESMESTLQDKDNLFVEKISYSISDPKRFDIVVLSPYKNKTDEELQEIADMMGLDEVDRKELFVKRVIGLPGETIQIKDNQVYINGEVLDDMEYRKNPDVELEEGIAQEPVTLGEDEYFLMGDNRIVSLDSRTDFVGTIEKELIEGRAWIRIWPFDKFGTVE